MHWSRWGGNRCLFASLPWPEHEDGTKQYGSGRANGGNPDESSGSAGGNNAVPTEDIPIVAAALEGGADYLVSDDSELLGVKMVLVSGYRAVQVIAPGPFVKQVLHISSNP